MNPTAPEVPTTPLRQSYGGTDNRSYSQSLAEIPALNSKHRGNLNNHTSSRHASTAPAPFTVRSGRSPNVMGSALSARSSNFSRRPSAALQAVERQLSLLDPLSDRVSTILVWQNLTVQIRENKKKEAFQRMKSYKTFVPKRKCLLNNVSGAIAGGLWAVMGKFYWS